MSALGFQVRPVSVTGEDCQKCVRGDGTPMQGQNYQDYDPRRRHNGLTCLSCGFEQELVGGGKSLIHTAGR